MFSGAEFDSNSDEFFDAQEEFPTQIPSAYRNVELYYDSDQSPPVSNISFISAEDHAQDIATLPVQAIFSSVNDVRQEVQLSSAQFQQGIQRACMNSS